MKREQLMEAAIPPPVADLEEYCDPKHDRQRLAPHQRDAAIAETDGPQTITSLSVTDGDQPARIPQLLRS